MERIITIVCLALSVAGLAYLKSNQMERLEIERLAQVEADSLNAIAAAEEAAEAAKHHFIIPHDSDMASDSIRIYMIGQQSSDPDGDGVKFLWEQTGGATLQLDSDTNSVTTFSAVNGEYSFRLTVTDAYGATSSDEATVKIHPEPNAGPTAEISVWAEE